MNIWFISAQGSEKVMIHLRTTNKINLNTKVKKRQSSHFLWHQYEFRQYSSCTVPSDRFIWPNFDLKRWPRGNIGDIFFTIFKSKMAFLNFLLFFTDTFLNISLGFQNPPTMKVFDSIFISLVRQKWIRLKNKTI